MADAIWDREVVSELFSTSGDYDLMAKVYIPDGQDVGHYLSERLFDIPHIVRTMTMIGNVAPEKAADAPAEAAEGGGASEQAAQANVCTETR